ncbi:SDR family oxidoreductase [Micromonospora zhanjiangensis]|uniref:SDR family oxidoreductase n=1 Tax=Micromonospora zhanjiangensis TaxID=1522057 RepID=A0ABV8KQ60_9ACTN
MRIAVVGATGRVGALTVRALERAGHETVRISRSLGVDVHTGSGLADALAGVDAVVDSSNTGATNPAQVLDFFATGTRNLLDAERSAGVRHHVLLSIVGIDRGQRNSHYDAKREQERLVSEGDVPWTILRATQFHDFAAMVAGRTERDGTATIAPLLVQPVAPADVADTLAEIAAGEPQRRRLDLAGPQTEDLVDMARRTFAARGRQIRLVPTWRGTFDVSMAGEVQLPGADARIGPTSFDDWLAAGAV